MKVAVCYCGQIRTGIKCIPNHLLYFGDIKPDFFVHTWTTNTNKRFKDGHEITEVPTWVFEEFSRLISPMSMVIEDAKVLGIESNHKNFHAQFYSWAKSIQLKQKYEDVNRFKYDVVVKMRPDVIIKPGNSLLNEIEKIQEHHSFVIVNAPPQDREDVFIDDVLWIASSEQMDRAIHFYNDRVKETNLFLTETTENIIQYLRKYDIHVRSAVHNEYTIYRKESEPLDPITEWEECLQKDWYYFGLINEGDEVKNSPGWVPSADENAEYYS